MLDTTNVLIRKSEDKTYLYNTRDVEIYQNQM